MENKEDRYTNPGVDVYYFVAPRTKGEEVSFPRLVAPPPEPARPSPPKPPKPKKEEYLGFKHYEAIRAKKRAIVMQCCSLIFVVGLLTFPNIIEFSLARFGPHPSPRIIPPPPYYAGEKIIGLSTKGEYHWWYYSTAVGWVDP
jgi:hypothetical protein